MIAIDPKQFDATDEDLHALFELLHRMKEKYGERYKDIIAVLYQLTEPKEAKKWHVEPKNPQSSSKVYRFRKIANLAGMESNTTSTMAANVSRLASSSLPPRNSTASIGPQGARS